MRRGTVKPVVIDRNASRFSRSGRNPRHDSPREAASTVRAAEGGIRTRFPPGTKYPVSHHRRFSGVQAKPEPALRPRFTDEVSGVFTTRNGKANFKTNIVAALSTMARRRSEPLIGSPCHRCPAFASFPPSRPRASGARDSSREPRDPGLPCRLAPAEFLVRTRAPEKTKNPPELRSGGSVTADVSGSP